MRARWRPGDAWLALIAAGLLLLIGALFAAVALI